MNTTFKKYKYFIFILAILLLAYLPFSSFLFSLKNDAYTDNFPDKFFFSAALHNGYLPLWNPYMNFGFPVYADPGFAFYNPITWFFGIIGYNAFTFTLEIILYLYLAGINTYLLCRYLSFNNKICLAIASMFMCSGFFVGNLQHINFLTAAAFVPLTIRFLLASISKPCFRNSFFLASSIYFVFVGGHPAIPIATIYFLFSVVIAFLFINSNADFSVIKRVGYLLLAVLILLSLSIPMLYSYLNILQVYSRGLPVSQQDLASGGTSFTSIISLLLPYSTIKGNVFFDTDLSMRNFYFSIIALLFLLSIKPKKETLAFITTGIIFFLFSLGGNVKHLIYNHLPGLSYIRINGEFRMFTILSFCIAAGYNLNQVYLAPNNDRLIQRIKKISISLLSVLVLFVLYILTNKPTFPKVKEQPNLHFNVSSIKLITTNLTFADSLLISLAIAIVFLVSFYMVIKRKLYHLIPLLIIIDVTLNLIIYLPITGIGQKNVAFVQNIYNRSPKGIPIPPLTPIEKLDSISTDESNLVGDWSYYNKQIGTRKITDYPSYFLSLEEYFGSNYPAFINKKPYLFTKQKDSKITVMKFSPQQININCSSSIADTLYFLQNNYKFWSAAVNGNKQSISTAFYSFMAVPIPKGDSKITFLYKDSGLLFSFIVSFVFLVFYIFLLLYIPQNRYYPTKM